MRRLLACVLSWAIVAPEALTAQSGRPRDAAAPVLVQAERSDLSPQLRYMSPKAVQHLDGVEVPRHKLPLRRGSAAPTAPVDTAVQDTLPVPAIPSTLSSFEGVGNVNGVLPPDPNGDVGPSHYVQTVNVSFAVFSKGTADTPPALLYGPAAGNTMFSGFGGPCEVQNDGDPIVLYDHLADRWLFSQLALPNNLFGLLFAPFYQCIAISATPDPLGPYYRYQFAFSKLNDYPKFGVWPDGYYMTINQYAELTLEWAGQGAVVFDRAKMLAGLPANGVLFDMGMVDPTLGGMLPSDLDGPPPPDGTPNFFVQSDDDGVPGYTTDQLQLWEFRTNWADPLSSTFTRRANLATAPYDSNLCGWARNCLPQPGTSVKLDALSDRLMYRLQYRNFGTHDSLVVNQTVDVDGQDHAGVRWYEIRNPGTSPVIFQQGTYAPDADHRWSASAAMDSAGNLAIGFSAMGPSSFPSIRYAGRLASDPLGVLAQGESDIVVGSGAQTHSSGRWGDYSMMAVDPVDGCTFWFTHEYYTGTSVSDWRTRVGTFRFPSCGSGTGNAAPHVSITAPADGSTVAGTVAIQVSASDGEDAAGTLTVEWNLDGGAWQPASYNSGTAMYDAAWDSTAVGDGVHTINTRAKDSGGLTAMDSNTVTVDNVADPPPATVHVGDLDGAGLASGKNKWTAVVDVYVHDSTHAVVAGALVSGTWSGGSTGTGSCTTGTAGTCRVASASMPTRKATATFTVTNVSKSGASYEAASNHDPESDSTGTAIAISRP